MHRRNLFGRAFKYSIPVLLGYLAIGIAFGLFAADKGFSWYVALFMSVIMYAGAGQYIAVALLASGAGLVELILVQFVVNARHIAYGMTMLSRFNAAPRYKPYLVFALTDETFALLSSLNDDDGLDAEERGRFMFLVSLFNQSYWIAGSVLGVLAGSVLSFDMTGVDFALTALFIVLLIEQIYRVKRAAPFVISALCACAAVIFLSRTVSLIAALSAALALVHLVERRATWRERR